MSKFELRDNKKWCEYSSIHFRFCVNILKSNYFKIMCSPFALLRLLVGDGGPLLQCRFEHPEKWVSRQVHKISHHFCELTSISYSELIIMP